MSVLSLSTASMPHVRLFGSTIDFRKSAIFRLQSFFHLVRLGVPLIATTLLGQVRP
jgi:hypothetical protein